MIDLVTGGAGFIGSHVVSRLVELGRSVRVVDDFSTGNADRLSGVRGQVDLVQADLVTADLAPIVAGVERIFHLAAIPSVPRSVKDPLTTHQATLTATVRLLVAARDAKAPRFVLSSSSSVYGDTPVSPKHEELPTRPISPYAVAKASAESYARVFATLYDMRTVSLRYFNVFGPSQDPTSQYAAVVPIFIRRALDGEALPVNGDGSMTRDFTYVDNVVDANIAAATRDVDPGAVYNIAAGDPHTILELAHEIGRIVGGTPVIAHRPERPGDIRHSYADIRRARAELGWTPRVSFEDGLRRTVDWYRSRPRG